MGDWIATAEKMPSGTCDINDLLLWCPYNAMGQQLMLGSFDGDQFNAFLSLMMN